LRLKQLFKLVLANIYQNKVRTFLTTLGVIVGTATILLVVAIGTGGEAQVNEQYARLNVGTIMVAPAQRGRVVDPLTVKDAQLFKESENIADALPILQGNGDINYDSFASTGGFLAIPPGFQQNNNLEVQQGRPLADEDEQKRNKIAVLGAGLANTLTGDNPSEIIGRSISINSRKFEVVGIYNRVGDAGSGMSYDDSAFITYSVGERYLLGTRANPTILVQATGLETVQPAINDITNTLNETHRMGGRINFVYWTPGADWWRHKSRPEPCLCFCWQWRWWC